MEEYKNIIYEKRGGIAFITINRPHVRNALNTETREELKKALTKAGEDDEVRVVVIKGAGEHFCAGADVREFMELSAAEMDSWIRKWGLNTITSIITSMRKPVIAAVDGYCLGGGCEMAMACDITIATERAKFGQTELRVGLIPGGGGTQRLARLVGLKKAKELVLTAAIIDAKEAERIGLVNRVVPPEKLEEAVEDICKRIMRNSPILIGFAKEALNAAEETSLSAGLEVEKNLFLRCWATEDRIEGLKAFIEKRKPEYKGR